MVWTSPRRKPAQQPDMRRCLVTGGAGFLGRHLVGQLLDNGRWDVTVFDVRALEGEERVQYIVGDLRDAEQVAQACKGEGRSSGRSSSLRSAWRHLQPLSIALVCSSRVSLCEGVVAVCQCSG